MNGIKATINIIALTVRPDDATRNFWDRRLAMITGAFPAGKSDVRRITLGNAPPPVQSKPSIVLIGRLGR
jgi:hypothetical protein